MEKKLKIAMIGQKHVLSNEGGVEKVVREISTRLVRLGFDVTCYDRKNKHVMDSDEDLPTLSEYNGVKIKDCFTIDKKGLAAVSSSLIGSLKILFSGANVVHYHAEGPSAMLPIIKFLSKKKVIVTVHGLDWKRDKWGDGFASKYIKFGEKMAAKYADEIIVLSDGVKKYFKETYNRDTHFIPNGITQPDIFDSKIISSKYNLNKDSYFLFLGRIVPEKGIHYLIDAYSEVKTDKKLVIAGGASDTDSYYEELRKKASNNENIIFTGFVQGQELEELYSNAYVYVLPSDLEGMPLSLLEAMSYGNCCLTSDIEECSDVMEDCGVTFKQSSVEDLANKLQYLSDSEKVVQKLKLESSPFIIKKYNWDDIVNKTLELYRG
ncbi:glycosyltransferase family 4 protein [Streptococcus lutetiensis]|uniref:glycosyltransferase family 4 protein n=1 Tax=Streptococcus lutetiensis TaxID=150055 RepID=UPI001C10D4E4|nr:glycosyltransferase family 4 protein [Streptococcus lutetiensis]MBU5320385.1 glycosyltransferase family 4 protein [Streptococcus lutetiensis]